MTAQLTAGIVRLLSFPYFKQMVASNLGHDVCFPIQAYCGSNANRDRDN
jgi:hypothetical protein